MEVLVVLGIAIVKGLAGAALWLASCFLFVKALLVKLRRHRRKLAATQLADLDTMSGEKFEEYLEILFERLGYEIDTTERYDKGADLIATREGVRTAIQAKHRRDSGRIGVDAVRTVVTALRPYKCTRGLVITTGYFSQQAKQAAKDNNIELWDRDDLTKQILALAAPGQPLPAPPVLAWLFEAPRAVPLYIPTQPTPATVSIGRLPGDYICATCGIQVSRRVREFCLARPNSFGGLVYCYHHQPAADRTRSANRPTLAEVPAAD